MPFRNDKTTPVAYFHRYHNCSGPDQTVCHPTGNDSYPETVQNPALRALAQTPKLPVLLNAQLENSVKEMTWLAASIRNIQGLGDRSAFGLPDEKGVVLVSIPAQSLLAIAGLRKGDVIRTANEEDIPNVGRLVAVQQQVNWTGRMDVTVMHNQQLVKLTVRLK